MFVDDFYSTKSDLQKIRLFFFFSSWAVGPKVAEGHQQCKVA
jgi:hypothetical protein